MLNLKRTSYAAYLQHVGAAIACVSSKYFTLAEVLALMVRAAGQFVAPHWLHAASLLPGQ